jgi:hypothetical protein
MLSFDILLPKRQKLGLSLFVLINNIFAIAVLVEVMSYNGILNLVHSREINLSKFDPFKGDKPLWYQVVFSWVLNWTDFKI